VLKPRNEVAPQTWFLQKLKPEISSCGFDCGQTIGRIVPVESDTIKSEVVIMPHGSLIETIPASSLEVFQLLHDYSRRLAWDTLLKDARLCEGVSKAQRHAKSLCVGRWYLGGVALETEYISFDSPRMAAVKMINRPRFFESFAATIKHQDRGDGTSTVEYRYFFTARPGWLRWLLHPLMTLIFRWETRKRLRGLRAWFVDQNKIDKYGMPYGSTNAKKLDAIKQR
jgi:hypothetical protein